MPAQAIGDYVEAAALEEMLFRRFEPREGILIHLSYQTHIRSLDCLEVQDGYQECIASLGCVMPRCFTSCIIAYSILAG